MHSLQGRPCSTRDTVVCVASVYEKLINYCFTSARPKPLFQRSYHEPNRHIYLETINPILPVLHRPTFTKDVANGLHLRDEYLGATLLLVLSVASRYFPSSPLPKSFFAALLLPSGDMHSLFLTGGLLQ